MSTKKSTVWRPTEAAAIGRVFPPRLPWAVDVYEMLIIAIRRHDQRAAQLLRNLLARTMSAGVVGEP